MTGNVASREKYLKACRQAVCREPLTAFTFDTDNCPASAIEYVCSLLEEYGLRGTFFCDNPYDNIHPPHEAALHPFIQNFSSVKSILEPVKALGALYPEAVGCRCHQLTSNGNLYAALPSLGIVYESSWPFTLQQGINPILFPSGLVQFPIFYSDGVFLHCGYTLNFQGDLPQPGLKVFSFHPVHIYHNTTPESYEELIKTPYNQRYVPELISKGYGIRDLFQELIEKTKSLGVKNRTLRETALEFARAWET